MPFPPRSHMLPTDARPALCAVDANPRPGLRGADRANQQTLLTGRSTTLLTGRYNRCAFVQLRGAQRRCSA
jgi:hypothetical protein